jgi:hypothetical protein
MNGIEKQAAFYRGYLTDERSLVPLTIILTSVLALWLLVYLVAAVAGPAQGAGGRSASATFIRNRPAASSPIRRDASTRTFPCCCARPTIELASCRTHTSTRQETQARSRLTN